MWDLFFNPLELTATMTGLISVILSWKKNIYTYFFGLISVSIYAWICFQAGIYADMAINIFYFLMSIYGWVNWNRLLNQNKRFAPELLNRKEWMIWIFSTLVFWLLIYFILIKYTNSNIPVADSFTTAFFITGMILMSLKITENWIFLIIGNIVSVPIYVYKELYISSVFFVILTFFAVLGYFNWKKESIKK